METPEVRYARAVQLLQTGRPDEALEQLAPLLDAPDVHPEVLHLGGVLRLETGHPREGRALLRRAAQGAPGNPEIPYNHGCALLRLGEAQAALEQFDACLGLAPGHAAAWNNRGNALRSLGRPDEAGESFRRALDADPNHAGAMCNLGQFALEGHDPEGARAWFERARRVRPGHLPALLGLGVACLDLGRAAEAGAALEEAVRRHPRDAEAWRWLGRARSELNDPTGAREACRQAVELAPESPDAWNNLGSACTALGLLEPARSALDRALSLDPGHREAALNRATLLELANEPEEALAWIEASGLANEPRAQLVAARCRLREGEPRSAEAPLRALLEADDPWLRKEACFTLGRVLDRSGRPGAAFEAYAAGNALAGELWRRAHPEEDRFVPGLAAIATMLEGWPAWAQVEPAEGPAPVFLFGFQRSGTTLLDTVLGAHPRVHVMEELPVVNRVIARMDRDFGPYPQALPKLEAPALAALRDEYWRQAAALGGFDAAAGRLLLDKSPLHTVHLALLRRLFPQSRLLFALRHPLDVVLSCFMQDFAMTSFMTHFTRLEGVARVYDAVMGLWRRQEPGLSGVCRTVRYERLVAAPEAELRAILAHLDLEWDPGVLDHGRAARRRGLINTPSYEQVTRPIYASARDRWRRYRDPLAAIMPVMRPWLEYFGYDAGDE